MSEFIGRYSVILIEIRKRLIFTLVFFAVGFVVGVVFYEPIIKFVIDLLSLRGVNIVFTSPFQYINLAISCGLAVGLIAVFPLLIFQVMSFLRPALKNTEFRMIVWFVPFSVVLFLIGFTFGVLVMKWQISMFLTKSIELGIGNILDISGFLSTVLLVSSIMGLAFQFPIVLLLLMRLKIITHSQLSKQRLWIYIGSLGLIFLLPVDAILADLCLALPLITLFEMTLLLDRFFSFRKKLAAA